MRRANFSLKSSDILLDDEQLANCFYGQYPSVGLEIHLPCVVCDFKTKKDITEEQFKQWYKGMKHIQDIFPEWTPGERELVISGLCDNCFPKDEEE